MITMLAASAASACDMQISSWVLQKGDVVQVTNAPGQIGQRVTFELTPTNGEVFHVISKTLLGQEMPIRIGNNTYRPIVRTPITRNDFAMELDSPKEAGYLEEQLKECL